MQIDLQTLWYLTVGTLLVSASLLLWERQAHPGRASVLGVLAAALFAFALGCMLAMNRSHFPVALGMGAINILMMLGYLMVLNAVAGLDGRRYLRSSVMALSVLTIVWAIAGTHFPAAFWNHVSSVPIALTSGLTAWMLLRSRTAQRLRSRPIAISILAVHAVFYFSRAFIAPVLLEWYGQDIIINIGKVTMYEAVLYSVAMPMSFLMMIREEEKLHLLHLSQTDQLTGLANRHAFFEQASRMLRSGKLITSHCSPSTSTTSRRSTTVMDIQPEIKFCSASPQRSEKKRAPMRLLSGLAVRNLLPSCQGATIPRL